MPMQSIRNIYKIGKGPSSSHTMGPRTAAEAYKANTPKATRFQVTLWGSLAATGKGHLTDQAIIEALAPSPVHLLWKPEESLPRHPNGMTFEGFDVKNRSLGHEQVYSIGGGTLLYDDSEKMTADNANGSKIYPVQTMQAIMSDCDRTGQTLWEYVAKHEGPEIWPYLEMVWEAMEAAIERGLNREGTLPGGLGLSKKASIFHTKTKLGGPHFKRSGFLSAYALAVSEENASGGIIVTAPTCGSAGVLPSILRYLQETIQCQRASIIRALATAGIIGNLIKQNASISGAEVGCQGEIGSACAMAAAAATQLMGGTVKQIEYAAEMGLEHHLGLTCDPVDGLVQIPCIERNAFGAKRALNCADFSIYSGGSHRVSFDQVVEVMKQTGHDLPSLYRETASGGLAKAFQVK